jgi:hypothetical protein
VDDWIGAYTNLVRDGALRTFSLLQQLATGGGPSTFQTLASSDDMKGKKTHSINVLQLVWIAVGAVFIFKPAQTVLNDDGFRLILSIAAAAVPWLLWRALKHKHAA